MFVVRVRYAPLVDAAKLPVPFVHKPNQPEAQLLSLLSEKSILIVCLHPPLLIIDPRNEVGQFQESRFF